MTKICAKHSWQISARFCDCVAVNFRGGFPRKIVQCQGVGHGGDSDISLVSTSSSIGVSKKANAAHPRPIGCERNIGDVENSFVVDSSSLWWNFRANSSMSRGGTWRRQRHFFGQHRCISKGVSKKANAAHKISCFIGCEVCISDVENPSRIVDSSSLAVEFPRKIVPCPGGRT